MTFFSLLSIDRDCFHPQKRSVQRLAMVGTQNRLLDRVSMLLLFPDVQAR
jgi:hypothetical protein